jgi:cytidylate kinase
MAKTYLKFLESYEKELSKKIKKKDLTITVSGISGAGKTDGAKALAKVFKLRYISAGKILRYIAKKRKMSLEQISAIRGSEIDHEMDRRSLEFAMKGKVVLDGRLTAWVAGDWADVRIFYVCPLNVRAERVAKRDNVAVEEAKINLQKRDKQDHEKYQKVYGIDSFDKSIYNIVIDNRDLTKKESKIVPVKLVKKFLGSKHSH